MEDFADLGLSTLERVIDKHHDRVYDGVSQLPTRIKQRRSGRQQKASADRIAVNNANRVSDTGDDDYYQGRESDRWMSSRYGDGDRRSGGRSRYGRGGDVYEPEQQGMNAFADRDGYARAGDDWGGGTTYVPYQDTYRTDTRYIEYPPGAYAGSGRYKSHDDLRSRRDRDDHDAWDYGEDNKTREQGLARRRDRERSHSNSRARRSKSRGRDRDEDLDDSDDNSQLKKWGATFAGAAVGAYGAKKMRAGNLDHTWVPAAVGAVIGGLVAREAEKLYYEKKEDKKERQSQGGWRSRSR